MADESDREAAVFEVLSAIVEGVDQLDTMVGTITVDVAVLGISPFLDEARTATGDTDRRAALIKIAAMATAAAASIDPDTDPQPATVQ